MTRSIVELSELTVDGKKVVWFRSVVPGGPEGKFLAQVGGVFLHTILGDDSITATLSPTHRIRIPVTVVSEDIKLQAGLDDAGYEVELKPNCLRLQGEREVRPFFNPRPEEKTYPVLDQPSEAEDATIVSEQAAGNINWMKQVAENARTADDWMRSLPPVNHQHSWLFMRDRDVGKVTANIINSAKLKIDWAALGAEVSSRDIVLDIIRNLDDVLWDKIGRDVLENLENLCKDNAPSPYYQEHPVLSTLLVDGIVMRWYDLHAGEVGCYVCVDENGAVIDTPPMINPGVEFTYRELVVSIVHNGVFLVDAETRARVPLEVCNGNILMRDIIPSFLVVLTLPEGLHEKGEEIHICPTVGQSRIVLFPSGPEVYTPATKEETDGIKVMQDNLDELLTPVQAEEVAMAELIECAKRVLGPNAETSIYRGALSEDVSSIYVIAMGPTFLESWLFTEATAGMISDEILNIELGGRDDVVWVLECDVLDRDQDHQYDTTLAIRKLIEKLKSKGCGCV